jgi:hypothetical protein
MNKSERLQLNKILQQSDIQDTTNDIRIKKHSSLIKNDVLRMLELSKTLSQTNNIEYSNILQKNCPFLYNNYTDIFNRVKNNELNLNILDKFLNVLKDIEDEKIDQHDGAFKVGELLKEIYIDSAIQKSNNIDKKYEKQGIENKQHNTNNKKNKKNKQNKSTEPVNISWKQYKMTHITK